MAGPNQGHIERLDGNPNTPKRQLRFMQRLAYFFRNGSFAGDGVEWDSTNQHFDIDLSTTSGLELTASDGTGELQVDAGDGITLDSDGTNVDVESAGAGTGGLTLTASDGTGQLRVDVGLGLELLAGGVTVDLEAAGSGAGGLEFVGNEIAVIAGDGIELTAGGVAVDLSTTSGLEFSSGELQVDAGDGIVLDSDGVNVDLATVSGLELTAADGTGELRIDLDSNSGLAIAAGGLSLDFTTLASATSVDADLLPFYDQTATAAEKTTTIDDFKIDNDIVEVLDRDHTEVELDNVTTLTSVYSFSVPADEMGTNRAIRFRVGGRYKNNAGATRSIEVQIKFGATKLWQAQGSFSTATAYAGWEMECVLSNEDDDAVQRLIGTINFGDRASVTTGRGALSTREASATFEGTSLEDTTGALTFDVLMRFTTGAGFGNLIEIFKYTGLAERV